MDATRLFVVCGRDADAGSLATLFSQHGSIESLRLLRDRGVAYVRYSRASSAAAAIEALHDTQRDVSGSFTPSVGGSGGNGNSNTNFEGPSLRVMLCLLYTSPSPRDS